MEPDTSTSHTTRRGLLRGASVPQRPGLAGAAQLLAQRTAHVQLAAARGPATGGPAQRHPHVERGQQQAHLGTGDLVELGDVAVPQHLGLAGRGAQVRRLVLLLSLGAAAAGVGQLGDRRGAGTLVGVRRRPLRASLPANHAANARS